MFLGGWANVGSRFGWDEGKGAYVRRSTEGLVYTPDALQGARMLLHKFEGFERMVNVTFGVADVVASVSVILWDDVPVCKYYK